MFLVLLIMWSLSARRAWIEMLSGIVHIIGHIVALRKESVDRNVAPVLAVGRA